MPRRTTTGTVALTAALAAMLTAGTATTSQAETTTFDPFDVAQGFTILAQGDANLGNGELEGSIAAFGTLASSVGNYPVLHQAEGDGDRLVPTVDGAPVRLFAQQLTGTGGFDVTNAGATAASSPNANATARFADVSNLTLESRGGGVGGNDTGTFARADAASGGLADLKAMPYDGTSAAGLKSEQDSVQAYFPDVDDDIDRANVCLADMDADEALAHHVTVEPDGNIVYLSDFADDRPNVVDYDDLAGKIVKLDRAADVKENGPTAQAPLVVRVSEGTTEIGPINIEGWSSQAGAQQDYARYIMLDLSQVTNAVTISGLEMGAVWAPDADVTFDSGITTNGQWVTKNLVTTGGGEIHHWDFLGELPCGDVTPTPTPTPTPTTTPTPTPTPTPTTTPSPVPSPSSSPSPSPSTTPTDSPSPTPSDTTPSANSSVAPSADSSASPSPSTSAASGPGVLPRTGPGAIVPLVGGAVVLLAVGGVLLMARRRVRDNS